MPKGNTFKVPAAYKNKKFSLSVEGRDNMIVVGNNFNSNDFELTVQGENNEVIIGRNFTNKGKCKIVVIGSGNKIIIGDDIHVVTQLVIYNHDNSQKCQIKIGNKTSFYKTEISTYDNESTITIGEDCMFAYDTIVYNTDGHSIFQNDVLINKATDLVVGNHVWCGWGSTLLKNSYIPDGCVVGKGALVAQKFRTKNAAIAGNPAKIIKENIRWDRKSVNETLLQHIKGI